MFDWFRDAQSEVQTGDPMASILTKGSRTEYATGEIAEFEDHPVLVTKGARVEGGETAWRVKIETSNGPLDRYWEREYADEFTAQAVFEKLKREYDLEDWEPPEEESDD